MLGSVSSTGGKAGVMELILDLSSSRGIPKFVKPHTRLGPPETSIPPINLGCTADATRVSNFPHGHDVAERCYRRWSRENPGSSL